MSRFIEMFSNCDGRYSTVGRECTLKSGTTFPSELELSSGDYPYSKVSDMNLPGNEVFMYTSSSYVSKETAKQTYIEKDSVVFPKRGASIATNKKRLLTRDTCVDLNTMGVHPGANLNPVYLYGYFDSLNLSSLCDGSTIPQLNNKNIAPLKIKVPDLELQKCFAKIFIQADKSKFELREAIKRVESMMKSLMN